MREPWKSKTVLLASREGSERTERERAWEDLVTGRAGTTPPTPPSQGGERAQRDRDEAQLVQDQLFTSPEPLCRPPFPDAEPVLGPWRPPRPRHARQDQQHGGARRSVPAARSETPPSSRPWECAWFELNRWESSRCRAERTPRIGGSTLRFNRLADRVSAPIPWTRGSTGQAGRAGAGPHPAAPSRTVAAGRPSPPALSSSFRPLPGSAAGAAAPCLRLRGMAAMKVTARYPRWR